MAEKDLAPIGQIVRLKPSEPLVAREKNGQHLLTQEDLTVFRTFDNEHSLAAYMKEAEYVAQPPHDGFLPQYHPADTYYQVVERTVSRGVEVVIEQLASGEQRPVPVESFLEDSDIVSFSDTIDGNVTTLAATHRDALIKKLRAPLVERQEQAIRAEQELLGAEIGELTATIGKLRAIIDTLAKSLVTLRQPSKAFSQVADALNPRTNWERVSDAQSLASKFASGPQTGTEKSTFSR